MEIKCAARFDPFVIQELFDGEKAMEEIRVYVKLPEDEKLTSAKLTDKEKDKIIAEMADGMKRLDKSDETRKSIGRALLDYVGQRIGEKVTNPNDYKSIEFQLTTTLIPKEE